MPVLRASQIQQKKLIVLLYFSISKIPLAIPLKLLQRKCTTVVILINVYSAHKLKDGEIDLPWSNDSTGYQVS